MLNLPLMKNNIEKDDIRVLIEFLQQSDVFTQSVNVFEFEKKWSEWLGVKHSVFLNSGSSANFITMRVIKELYGGGEVLVPALTWSSDVSSVLAAGLQPVFVDINLKNLSMAEDKMLDSITKDTKAVFLTHALGFNGLSERFLKNLINKNILIIEDVCESHGATYENRKVGTFGIASNFSFYYAHHMSTIEGGMLCTNDEDFYQYARLFRSHGMLRESTNADFKQKIAKKYPELREEFLFLVPGYNMRSTEINAIIGLNQLKRLDDNNKKKQRNFKLFLDNLDKNKYYTEFDDRGSVNYALTLILREKNENLFSRITKTLFNEKVEFRRGTAGGGNMTRQPFVQKAIKGLNPESFHNADHVHFYGLYMGNYPGLESEKIFELCRILNKI